MTRRAMLFLLIPASATIAAADMLPLTKGIYVIQGVPCKGASNADTAAYWGGNNAINDQQTQCKIKRLKKDGASYRLTRDCVNIREDDKFTDELKLTVLSRTAFRIQTEYSDQRYRYCGPKVQF